MKDNLDTSMFNSVNEKARENRETIKNLNVYKQSQPVQKRTLKKSAKVVLATALALTTSMVLAGAIKHNNDYEKVLHGRDYASEGEIYRVEELNEETWAADYKYVNEGANLSDAIDAYNDGEYTYYINHDGEVKVDKDLQATIEAKEKNATDYYNTTCVEFANQVLNDLNLEQSNQK